MDDPSNTPIEALQALGSADAETWEAFLSSKGADAGALAPHQPSIIQLASALARAKHLGLDAQQAFAPTAQQFDLPSTTIDRVVALIEVIPPQFGDVSDYSRLLGRGCFSGNEARPFLLPVHSDAGLSFELRWSVKIGYHGSGDGSHQNISLVLTEPELDALVNMLMHSKAEGNYLRQNLPKSCPQ